MQHRRHPLIAALILGATATLLAGCGALDKIDQMQADADRDTCTKYGFLPGTDPFASCMQRTAMERQRRFDAQTQTNMNMGNKPADAPRTDCKTNEVTTTSADGTSTSTKRNTTCVGM